MFMFYAFVLALCSIAYELLLGQTLSAFLGNTVLRYSVTIGLYMMSMGIGALLASRNLLSTPLRSLQIVEVLLSAIGALSLSVLFFHYCMGIDGVFFSAIAHALIIVIGILTGLELPLLFAVGKHLRGAGRNTILGVDYIGGFAGTLLFAFYLYPSLGLFASCFLLAALNGLVGVGLYFFTLQTSGKEISFSYPYFAMQACVLGCSVAGFFYANAIDAYWLAMYVQK
jgi:spermidine synthase